MRDQKLDKDLWRPRARALEFLRQERRIPIHRIAKRVGASEHAVRDWLNGAHAPSEKFRDALASVFGSSWYDLCRVLDKNPNVLSDTRRMDKKTVIQERDVSEEILGLFDFARDPGARPPRVPKFRDVARASASRLFDRDLEKDLPPPGMDYFHFIQVAGVITLLPKPWNGPRSWVVYERTPSSNRDQYVHTQGGSVLLAASFEINAAGTEGNPMEEWLYHAGTAESFLLPPKETLRVVLTEKIDFHKLEKVLGRVRITPFGLVTADQRGMDKKGGGKHNRIYSQYVFLIEGTTNTATGDWKETLTKAVGHGTGRVTVLRDADMTEDGFRGDKPRLMDLVVWKAKRENLPSAFADGGGQKVLFVACTDFLD